MSLLHFPEKTFTSNPRQMASRWWKVAPGNMLQTLSLIPKIYPTSYVTCSYRSSMVGRRVTFMCVGSTLLPGSYCVFEKITKREGLESKASLAAAFAERRFRSRYLDPQTSHEDGNVVLLPQVSKIWYSELAVHNASAENGEQWFAVTAACTTSHHL